MSNCTNWQMRCACDACERNRRSLYALHESGLHLMIDQVVFQTRLYQEEARELREALLDVAPRRATQDQSKGGGGT
jgi:hypothetical protein